MMFSPDHSRARLLFAASRRNRAAWAAAVDLAIVAAGVVACLWVLL